MEANNKTAHADNESALSKNQAAVEGLRTDVEKALGELRAISEKNSRVLLLEIAVVVGLGVAVMSLIVGLIVS